VSPLGFGQSLALSNSLHPNCARPASLCHASQKDAFVRYRRIRVRDSIDAGLLTRANVERASSSLVQLVVP